MLSLIKTAYRVLQDVLRYGFLTLDQVMVLQGKAFRSHLELTIPANGSVDIYFKAGSIPPILSDRLIESESSSIVYKVFADAVASGGTEVPSYNRNTASTTTSQMKLYTGATFQNNGVEVDLEPFYGEAATGVHTRSQLFDSAEIRALAESDGFRINIANQTAEPQKVFLRWRWYETLLANLYTGKTNDF